MKTFNYDRQYAVYTAQGYTEAQMVFACENAIQSCIDCEGQTSATVHDWINTPEGNERFGHYFIASVES